MFCEYLMKFSEKDKKKLIMHYLHLGHPLKLLVYSTQSRISLQGNEKEITKTPKSKKWWTRVLWVTFRSANQRFIRMTLEVIFFEYIKHVSLINTPIPNVCEFIPMENFSMFTISNKSFIVTNQLNSYPYLKFSELAIFITFPNNILEVFTPVTVTMIINNRDVITVRFVDGSPPTKSR